ncbi:MAG: sulfatase [Planctomycetes bacterium]|nr:sulfatase [Planctomycetota bacterium]
MLRPLAAVATVLLAACAARPAGDRPGDASPAAAAAPRRPNVLFIAVDDLRPELGCYGAKHAVTPHLDELARSGVTFTRAYCQSAVCNPSRASLMTGLRPDTTGVLDLATDLRKVAPDVVTLPQHFRAQGWFTASIGKLYHNVFPDAPSWDERVYLPGYPFDPDAVYRGEDGLAVQAARQQQLIDAGRADRARDRFGFYYLKAQATEAPDVDDDAYYDGAQTSWAVDRLGELAAASRAGQPFFLAVGYYRPHLPFNAPKRYWDLYDRASVPLAVPGTLTTGAPPMAINTMRELRGYTDFRHIGQPADGPLAEAEQRLLVHGYLASVSYVDAQIGRLLAALDEQGLRDDTIVVLWSDHGWKLGDHCSWGKMTNYEIDTRVPLLVRAPGAQDTGAQCDRLVELVDLFPTLCELCGITPPAGREGASLAPLLRDPSRAWKRAAFSQYLRDGPWIAPDGIAYQGRAIRTETHRYVEWRRVDDGALAGVELYDLTRDPGETVDLAAEPAQAELVAELAARLHAGWRAAMPAAGPQPGAALSSR